MIKTLLAYTQHFLMVKLLKFGVFQVMAPKENPNWVPTPVYLYIQYLTVVFPIQPDPLPQPQPAIDSDDNSNVDSDEEYLGYPSIYYLYFLCVARTCTIQFLWLSKQNTNPRKWKHIWQLVRQSYFGHGRFFFLRLPIPEDENIFGNLFGNHILFNGWDENQEEKLENDHAHGFYRLLFGYGFVTSPEEFDEVFGSFHACNWNCQIKIQN